MQQAQQIIMERMADLDRLIIKYKDAINEEVDKTNNIYTPRMRKLQLSLRSLVELREFNENLYLTSRNLQ